MTIKRVVPFVVIVSILALAVSVAVAANLPESGYGYGGPSVSATPSLIPSITAIPPVTDFTATPEQVPTSTTEPTATATATVAPTAASGGISLDPLSAPVQSADITGVISIPTLWDEVTYPLVHINADVRGVLQAPVGSVGMFESPETVALVCHRDYLDDSGQAQHDICYALSRVRIGDRIHVNDTTWYVSDIIVVDEASWWPWVKNRITLSTCQEGSWNGSAYTQRRVLVLSATP